VPFVAPEALPVVPGRLLFGVVRRPDDPVSLEVPILPPEVPDPPELAGALVPGGVVVLLVPDAPVAGLPEVVPGAGAGAGVVVVVVVDDSVLPGVVDGAVAGGGVLAVAGGEVVVVMVLLLVTGAAGSLLALRLQALSTMPTTAVANMIFVTLIGAFIMFPFIENDNVTQFDRGTASRFLIDSELLKQNAGFMPNPQALDAPRAVPSNYVKITVST
jgi:hypothetical protein